MYRYSSTEMLAAVSTLRAASGKDLFVHNTARRGFHLCERGVSEPVAFLGFSISVATERLLLMVTGTQLAQAGGGR